MSGLVIDNFAGGGGASTGIEQALGRAVDVAINHDEAAIAVHTANHPGTRHFCQSIYSVDPLEATGGKMVALVWFSPDCKHHSKAKGGKPRDKRIRDLAHVVPHWIERLKKATVDGEGAPEVICLENVEEFRQWGPLDADGMPIKERRGEEFDLWVRHIRRLGYKVDWWELRACDYGVPTTRNRLYLVARRDGLPIVKPAPTHGRPDTPEVQSGKLLPWRTAADDVIDWSIPCPSIFDRKKPLAEATHKRIAAGVMRYVVEAARPFIVPNNTNNVPKDVDEPLPTVTTGAATLIQMGYGERAGQRPRTLDMDAPLGTVVAAFLHKYRPNSVGAPADGPLPTVTANSFIKRGGGAAPLAVTTAYLEQANTGMVGHDARRPVSTIVGKGSTQRLVETTLVEEGALPPEMMARAVQVAAFLVKYYGAAKHGQSLDEPLHAATVKPRFAVVTVTIDAVTFVLVDIGMRMLEPRELANAMGLPRDYILDPVCWYRTDGGARKYGRLPKSHQIAKIGNMVCPGMAKAVVSANVPRSRTVPVESVAA